jgi:hypothetical protein
MKELFIRNKVGLFLIAGAGVLLWPAAARGTVLSIQPSAPAVQAGQVGAALEILLTNTGAASITVAGFSFQIATTDADILFTDANASTVAAAYIFGGGDSFFGPDLAPGFVPADSLNALDLSFSGTGTVLNPGATVSLGRVLFDVANNASAGPFTMTFSGGATFNNLSDALGNNIAIDSLNDAQITTLVSSVPEPGTPLLLVGSMALLWFGRRFRRR